MRIEGLSGPMDEDDAVVNAVSIPAPLAVPPEWMFLQAWILDQMHDSIVGMDVAGTITGCNRAATAMFGYTAEELIGRPIEILYPEEDREALRGTVLPAVLATGEYRGEVRNLTRSGALVYVHLSLSLLRDPSGNAAGMVGFSVDVTERKRLQEELARSEARLQFLTESMPQLLWTAGPDGMCQFVSQACAHFLGVAARDVLGTRWQGFIHPEDRERTGKVWTDALATGETFVTEYRLRRRDGEYLWFLHRAVPRRSNETGEILEWIGSSTDIEKQKRSEETIRQTEKLAAVGRLASSIAHEINNPLAAVTNLLYLLNNETTLSRNAQAYVKSAQEELARVSEITTQTLRFHNQSTAAVPARIAEILDSVLAFFRPRFGAMSIQVRREYKQTDQLTCFAGDVRQALSNLIANALEASAAGGRLRIRLRTSLSWRYRLRAGVRITIADSGKGDGRGRDAEDLRAVLYDEGDDGDGAGVVDYERPDCETRWVDPVAEFDADGRFGDGGYGVSAV
jgi:PAS domain S-box-containing protein